MLARNVQREIERDLNLQSKAAMANSDAGTSSGSAGGGKYQVFLSFCGQDTRDGFTSFLYEGLRKNGIHAFMDDEEIRVGKKIADEILQAIDGSEIYVPIFSENYASRKWCLLELIRMVDNISKSKEKQIRPIFFYVEPNHLKTESYKNFIGDLKEEHEKKQQEKKQQEKFHYELESWKLESWEEAPTKVVESKGSKLQKGESQAKFVDKIVEELLQELKIKYKSVSKDLVGLDHRVGEVLKLLDQVRLLGIYGMGGIGKTTLAKVVYDKLYSRFGNCCAFLADIRETSKKKDLVSLQKKLLTAIGSSSAAKSIHEVDEGRKKIEKIIGDKEVLVVLDDVGEEEQIKNLIGQRQLRPGTRVIITTRTASVLKFNEQRMHFMEEINSDCALQISTYEMKGMESRHAIELFERHAFRGGSSAEDFDNLSVDIVNTTGSLPLALEVIGSLLHGKPKAKWESTLKQLRKVPHKDVQKTLMISYKDLNYCQREIFLDIACFFINEDKTNANYMWEACGFYPNVEIDILVEMSLINIKDNEFWMHDQLRDLGREIVSQESPTILGRRSRLWANEEVLDLVRTKLRKKKVEAIDLRGRSSDISIKNEEIERFESLRFLRLSNGTLHGDFTDCLPMLKWISWSSPRPDCSVANMHLKNLVVLELLDNCFADDSKVWDSLKMATKLKSLALVKCCGITRTPDLSKCLALERLTFDNCWNLIVINDSITMLTCLLDLNITHCGHVERVPNDIGSLEKLERFSLKSCHKVGVLPPSIGNLASLRKLDISMTGITSLPDTIEGLLELQGLCLKDTKIRRLPNSVGKLISLRTLDLSLIGVERYIDQWELPKAIGKLDKLEELYLGYRYELVGKIPDEIEGLSSLRVLDLCWTRICQIPETIYKLPCLLTLDLIQCNKIKELPKKLPTSLVCLRVESQSLEVVPNLSELTNLMELFLSNGSGPDFFSPNFCSSSKLMCDLRWIERLSKLEKLTLYLVNEVTPPTTGPRPHLNYHDLCWQLPPSLLSLELNYFSLTGSLLSNLKILSNLTLRFSRVQEMQLDGLLQLHYLMLRSCNLKSLSIPSSLRTLTVIQCPDMIEIQLLGKSASREELSIDSCKSIGKIVLCSEVGSLGVLNQSESSLRESNYCSLEVPPKASKKLKKLKLQRCTNIPETQVIGSLFSLQDFTISGCNALVILSGVSNLKNLQSLKISKCYKLRFVEGLDELEFLSNLDVSYCPSLETLLDRSNSKISERCLIKVHNCGELPNSSSDDPITFKRYKRIAQQGAPQPEKKKSMEEMKDEAGQRAADMETSDRNYATAAVQNVVGIDDRVKKFTDLLEMEVNDEVHIIGIYGTDGIGKTTLAKVVYDRISSRFDSCSFLAEVEETTQNPRGIQFLQAKLISDILERDCEDPFFDETIEIFLDIFCEMKVLIVVDDVEKQSHLHAIVGDQLHWFGPGSRIIVTSQNKEILKEYDPEKARTYTVGALDDSQVFELFCKHAFRMQSSIPDYDGLANRIVKATEKLPLAVEVVGSLLRGKSIREWEKMEMSMKQFMMNSQKTMVGLEEILNICYKELDQQQKETFLDIACFISGVDARIASYMWPNCYLPSSDCILMPLAKIGENNELQMHRLLRCLGKRILNQEGSGYPVGRKFYIQDMVPKEISREKGVENVEALCSDFTAGDFQTMPGIRFLKLDNAKVSGNFAGAFANLRWLCWQRFPLEFDAFNFVLGELVILDLSWGKVTEDWRGWSQIKMEKLRVLNLTGCSALLITPDFSCYKNLEMLILERCSRLVKLDPSIGHLKRLVSLNLKFCSQLNGLPEEVGCLTALKEIFIDGTSVREIPISIGNLKQLEILSGLKCFPLTHLPRSISYLTALSELSLDGAKITKLPISLGELLNLRRLSLRDCRYMRELPDSIGKIGSLLEQLDISATSISELPSSIKNLQNLRVLRMDSSFIRAFPREIGKLTKLEELHASWCRSLKGAIPGDIKGLHRLRSLTLGHSSISSLPSEISTISGLQTLDLLQCNEIAVLPELPPSLICLRLSSKRMKVIPLLKGLKELEELCLSDEDPVERRPPSEQPMPESNVQQPLSIWFSRLWNLELFQTQRIDKQSFLISFPKLRKLELSLSQIVKLKFELTDIPQLKMLTLSGLSLKEVSELPKTLSVFELYHSAMEEIKGLEGLEALKRLDISNCNIQNLTGIGQLTSLISLILCDCDYLSLPDLSNLKSLKVLDIRRCKMIHQIEGLEKLTSLEKLNISECPAENSVQVENIMAR